MDQNFGWDRRKKLCETLLNLDFLVIHLIILFIFLRLAMQLLLFFDDFRQNTYGLSLLRRFLILLGHLHREREGRAFGQAFGLHANRPSVSLHNLLTDCKTKSDAFLIFRS